MKTFHFLCFFLFVFSVNAQIKFSASTLSGYENNINKTPNNFESEGELLEKEDLHVNDLYQDVNISFKFSKKWKKDTFKIGLYPKKRFYFQESELNTTVFNSSLKHERKLKKTTWKNYFLFKRKNRNGQDFDQNEFSLPLGYKFTKMQSGIDFKLHKKNKSNFKIAYALKDFDETETQKIQYKKLGTSFSYKNSKWKNHLLHKYGFTSSWNQRFYAIENLEEETTSQRTWNYFNTRVFYKYPFSKKWNLYPTLSYEKRIDISNKKFGYQQIKPSLEVRYKSKKIKFEFTTAFTNRSFKNLSAKNNNNLTVGNLKYKYVQFKANASYNFTTKLSIIANALSTNRNSNNTIVNSSAFRSYKTTYFGVGLKWKN